MLLGDCLEKMRELPDNSVDSIVTDPPYGLSFMGKKWDYDIPSVDIWREALRVLKPGGHALIACGTRTQHRMVTNVEDAGFEIRDVISHLYGSGFPKSLNVQKSARSSGIGCACETSTESQMRPLPGADLQKTVSTSSPESSLLQPSLPEQSPHGTVLRPKSKEEFTAAQKSSMEGRSDLQTLEGQLHRTEVCAVPEGVDYDGPQRRLHNGAPASYGDASKPDTGASGSRAPQGSQYSKQLHNESRAISKQSSSQTCGSCGKTRFDPGLGTALKPACEFWTLCRKPLEGTVAANVEKWGCGALNIDASRVGTDVRDNPQKDTTAWHGNNWSGKPQQSNGEVKTVTGRWPANLILDEEAAALLNCSTGQDVARFFYVCGHENIRDVATFAGKKVESSAESLSIDGFGSTLTALYLTDTTFIIETETLLIIVCQILNASTRTCIGTITIDCEKITNISSDTSVVGVSVVNDTEGFLHLNEGKLVPFKGTASIVLDKTSKNGAKPIENITTPITETTDANRFLYCAKASKSERNAGLEGMPEKPIDRYGECGQGSTPQQTPRTTRSEVNHHPTVKPIRLMEYLIRLVTQPCGTVLDPFMGSGSTGVAAKNLGFKFIGIEMNEEYFEIAKKRVG